MVAAKCVPATPARGRTVSPGKAAASAAPTRSTSTGSGPHNGPRPSIPISNSPNAASIGSPLPARLGLNAPSASNAASAADPVRVGIGLDEGRLRDESMGARQRHAAPDAQRSSGPVGVDDRPRIPRPAAEDERAGREGLGASGPRQVEGQMRDEEVETSHGRGSFDRGPRAG